MQVTTGFTYYVKHCTHSESKTLLLLLWMFVIKCSLTIFYIVKYQLPSSVRACVCGTERFCCNLWEHLENMRGLKGVNGWLHNLSIRCTVVHGTVPRVIIWQKQVLKWVELICLNSLTSYYFHLFLHTSTVKLKNVYPCL